MTVALEALGSLVFRTYELPKDVWRDDVVHVDGLHSEAFEEILGRHRHLKSGGDVSNLVIEGRPGVGKTHFLGRVRAYVVAQGDFFVYVDLSSTHEFWQSLVEYYLDAVFRPNREGQTQLSTWSAALFKSAGLSQEQCAHLAQSTLGDGEIASLRSALRQYLGNSPRPRTAQDVAIALMLQASDDGHAQDVGMSFLRGLDIEAEDKSRYGFLKASLPGREVIRAIDVLVEKAGKVSVVCVDQLDGLVATLPETGGQLLDQIANGLMDLAQECPKSLIALSCLQATWKRIETETVQSAPARFPVVKRLGSIPSPEVGEALIAAYFSDAYKKVRFTPPYPTWPIKLNLSYLNARYYDGSKGQFLSEDPVFWEIGQTQDGRTALLNPQAQNSYGYASGNPIVGKDPSGRFLVGAGIGAVVGTGVGIASLGMEDFVRGQPSGMDAYAARAAGGFVAGGMIGATAGASLFITASVGIGAGAAGGATESVTQQAIQSAGGPLVINGEAVGSQAFEGALFGSVPGLGRLPGFNGRGTLNSIARMLSTKLEKGTIQNLSTQSTARLYGASALNQVPGSVLQSGFSLGNAIPMSGGYIASTPTPMSGGYLPTPAVVNTLSVPNSTR